MNFAAAATCLFRSLPTHLQAEKLVLAEGSKFVMAGLSSSYDQGVMGLVTNLGSLVVRTLFQPLEEVAFAAFSRYAAGEQQH
jgi:oligosaccharide translocation protein RFT1